MRRLIFLLTLLAAALSFTSIAQAQNRVALVIGNGAYASMPRLPNPANDAADMAATLRGLGFALVGGGPQVNVGRLQFLNLLRDFAAAVRPGDVALFYYAGHGLQVEGVNYMAPVDDRDIRYQEDVPDLAVSLNTLQRYFKDKGAAPLIVILDACRDNPLPSRNRNASRGLARLELGSGAYMAFATSPGSTANDGAGRNGRFTAALLQALREPARRIEDVFIDVTNWVEAESGGGQSPWTSSNLRAPFHFAGTPRPPSLPPMAAVSRNEKQPAPEINDDRQHSAALNSYRPIETGKPNGGFIFPDSDRRYLSRSEIANLSQTEMRIARNEIYARRGRYFKDAELQRYFAQFSWYSPYTWEPTLSSIENANVLILKQLESMR